MQRQGMVPHSQRPKKIPWKKGAKRGTAETNGTVLPTPSGQPITRNFQGAKKKKKNSTPGGPETEVKKSEYLAQSPARRQVITHLTPRRGKRGGSPSKRAGRTKSWKRKNVRAGVRKSIALYATVLNPLGYNVGR